MKIVFVSSAICFLLFATVHGILPQLNPWKKGCLNGTGVPDQVVKTYEDMTKTTLTGIWIKHYGTFSANDYSTEVVSCFREFENSLNVNAETGDQLYNDDGAKNCLKKLGDTEDKIDAVFTMAVEGNQKIIQYLNRKGDLTRWLGCFDDGTPSVSPQLQASDGNAGFHGILPQLNPWKKGCLNGKGVPDEVVKTYQDMTKTTLTGIWLKHYGTFSANDFSTEVVSCFRQFENSLNINAETGDQLYNDDGAKNCLKKVGDTEDKIDAVFTMAVEGNQKVIQYLNGKGYLTRWFGCFDYGTPSVSPQLLASDGNAFKE